MKELTGKEAMVTVGAINTTLNMLDDLLVVDDSIDDARKALLSARDKIEKSYKENK